LGQKYQGHLNLQSFQEVVQGKEGRNLRGEKEDVAPELGAKKNLILVSK